MSEYSRQHDYYLDYLRVFATFAVFWVHLSMYLDIPDSFRKFFTWGANGVQIFFVLSGYLAATTFHAGHVSSYYKKRARRILPSYYTGIVCMIVIHSLIDGAGESDIYHLGYLRYFLGLNTVLPSNNYALWNNLYGYWTMSCFLWFYAFVPLIMKGAGTFRGSLLVYLCSFACIRCWRMIMYNTFGDLVYIDRLSTCIELSPFVCLHYFVLGIVVQNALKENKEIPALLICMAVIAYGFHIRNTEWMWGGSAGILLLAGKYISPWIHNCRANKMTGILSRQSFNVYLSHLMCFHLSWEITAFLTGTARYLCWLILFVVFIILLVRLMNAAENIINQHAAAS